ncbi:MAG: hypothetical protein K2X48_15535 [Chitinophagaceae bacterium]|nr:hypothetical protein [Chitinophagaceae bacterium]
MSKYGNQNGIQRYKCASCGKVFQGGSRLAANQLWQEYTMGKQTYAQLAMKYGCSIKTVQRKIDTVSIVQKVDFVGVANVVMDTTYFGRRFGVMVFKDSLSGQILYKQYVHQETNKLYLQGIEEIARRGIRIQAIICDGRKGLFQLFDKDVPVQMCNFHQVAIVRRYLTKKPKLQASKELWELTMLLVNTDKESFTGGLQLWYSKWEAFLNERRIDTAGKKRYVHKKLRSAYRSLKTNLPYLFTWYDNMELKIPNTTNAIDGHFADLKNKLRNHNGLSIARKKKFIDEFFKA